MIRDHDLSIIAAGWWTFGDDCVLVARVAYSITMPLPATEMPRYASELESRMSTLSARCSTEPYIRSNRPRCYGQSPACSVFGFQFFTVLKSSEVYIQYLQRRRHCPVSSRLLFHNLPVGRYLIVKYTISSLYQCLEIHFLGLRRSHM
jgi:hypothetical protein